MEASKSILKGAGLFLLVFSAVYGGLWLYDKQKGEQPPLIYRVEQPIAVNSQNSGAIPADFRASVKKILPSIVSIDTLVAGEDFFGRRFISPTGSGSGVVLSADGYIVTNNHVVTVNNGRRAVDRVIVKFDDGKSVEAKIIGRDPRADVAVLKVDKAGLQPIAIGDSSSLEVGQWVIAAGNPLGFEHTISVGVVSSIGRPLQSQANAVFVDGIQTDAAINQGNSGGALCDAQGRLIGINTMIASTDQGSVGIGFAIPANRVRQVVDDLIKFGRARYGRIGISVRSDSSILSMANVRRELMRQVGASTEPPSTGVLILDVFMNGPAYKAGLRPLDVIQSLNGKAVSSTMDYQIFMADKKPGEKIQVKVWSAGQTKTVTVTLDEASE
ncbi:trypsin-like peptidase domain-containing protein [Kamptonema cortianum]|nr:trypsin-like peptidase domain-containing protein [Geitlerinema splendidum]MDK3161021.1 trypsin-like peptidase domain-containing protein [Kamptonema cortianum]